LIADIATGKPGRLAVLMTKPEDLPVWNQLILHGEWGVVNMADFSPYQASIGMPFDLCKACMIFSPDRCTNFTTIGGKK